MYNGNKTAFQCKPAHAVKFMQLLTVNDIKIVALQNKPLSPDLLVWTARDKLDLVDKLYIKSDI